MRVRASAAICWAAKMLRMCQPMAQAISAGEIVVICKKCKSEFEIRDSWEEGLRNYKQLRKSYLLYEDFE